MDAASQNSEVSPLALLPPVSDLALKEWAVAVTALAEAEQIIILRKGGIHKEDKEFRVVHPEFLLYPTYEHQQLDLIKNTYHGHLEQTLEENDVPGLVTLGLWCQVTDKFEVRDDDLLDDISPYHIWTADYAKKRLHWRPKQPLTVAAVRVYRLQQPQALPILDDFAGCKSWVDLQQEVPLGYMAPVLSDDDYENKADSVRRVLGTATSPV